MNKMRGATSISQQSGFLKDILLENYEYGVYVRGGTILPIKLHRYAQSILRTVLMPIRLDIYLSTDRKSAKGMLYMDDGETYRYDTHKEKTLIQYTFEDNVLYSQRLFDRTFSYESAFTL